jgi:hypothetical protein
VIGWNNDADDATDAVGLSITFSEPLFGLEFSILDVVEAELLSADGNNPWDDVVSVGVNGSLFLSSNTELYTLQPCVTISNEVLPDGSGNGFEGLSSEGNDTDAAPACPPAGGTDTTGSNISGASDAANVDFAINRLGPTLAPLAVSSIEVDYRPGGDARPDFGFPYPPIDTAGQRIGISNIAFPLINGHVYRDADGNGTQNGAEIDLVGIAVFLCATPNPSAPCDPTDPEYLAQTVTDANGEYGFAQLAAGVYRVDSDPTTDPSGSELNLRPHRYLASQTLKPSTELQQTTQPPI